MRNYLSILAAYLLLPFAAIAQKQEVFIDLPKEQWPQIALINKVKYKNGDSYIDPSITYAGTGFLINIGNDTLAATANHVLWVAKNTKSKRVQINSELQHWVMMSKTDSNQYAVMDSLVNEDSTEILEGNASTILDRDLIIFSVKQVSPGLYPLKPRYGEVKPGEKVYILSCEYKNPVCKIYEGRVFKKLGMDILIERNEEEHLPGCSGSAVIDAKGYLVGIISSASTNGKSGKAVSVAISTEYLYDVLQRKSSVNAPKKDYGELIYKTAVEKGAKAAIAQYNKLISDPKNYYTYNLRSANRNGLHEAGEKLMAEGKIQDAIGILRFNIEQNPAYFVNYNSLAKAYLQAGNKNEAIKYYRLSTEKYNDKEENEAFAELQKLEK